MTTKMALGLLLLTTVTTVGGVAWGSSCAEDGYESLSLEVREVKVDGVVVDDLGPWQVAARVTASWEDKVYLTIGEESWSFAVQP